MSLIHWWPLNGDDKDQGTKSLKVITSNINYSFGKIGKSANFANDNSYIKVTDLTDLTKLPKYSMCCWVRLTSAATNHSSSFLSSGDWNIGDHQVCFALYNFSNNTYKNLLFPNKEGWSRSISLKTPILLNHWYHIAIIYDGIKTKAYVNGIFQGESNSGGISTTNVGYYYLGAATYYSGFTMHGQMNDFRIYDHDLSQKEIHEISKGLFAHYSLNNILPKIPGTVYTMSTYNGATGKYGNESNIAQEIIYYSNPEGIGKVLKISNKIAGNNWNYMFFNNIVSNENTKKVLSFDFFADISSSVNFYSYRANYIVKHKENGVWVDGGRINVTPFSWNHIIIRWEGHNAEYNAGPGYMQIGNGAITTNSDNIWYIANIRVNDGDEPAGASYDISGGGLFTSGNGEHLILDNNSQYYQNCIYFNGSNSYIDTPVIIKEWAKDNAISLNFWIKPTDNLTRSILGTLNYHWILQRRGNNSVTFNQWDESGGHVNSMSVTSKALIPVNQWTMISIVWTGNTIKLFINGVYDNQVTANFNKPNKVSEEKIQIGGNIYSWGENGWFKGFLSDIRIYESVLSDSDILKLYNTPKVIDDHNNLYAKMFDENNKYIKSSISKKGIQKVSELNEKTGSVKEFKNGIIQANSFNENF